MDDLKVVTKRAANRSGTERYAVCMDRGETREIQRDHLRKRRRNGWRWRWPDEPR